MKKNILFAAAIFLLTLTGCTEYQLKSGQYNTTVQGKEDQIAIYDNLIFMKITTPADSPDKLEYWQWAGKYSVNEFGEISFDMDKLTKKKWNFYFSFVLKQGNIVVYNQGDSGSQTFKFSPVKKRKSAKKTDQGQLDNIPAL